MNKTHIAGVIVFVFVMCFLMAQPLMAGDTASNPYPTDEDTNGASPDIVVSWTAGDNAAATDGHGVYWGTDHDAVNNATTASDEYMGAQTATTYDPAGSLTAGVTYYWRIDELNPEVSPYVWKGDVWSFIVWDGSGLGDFANGYAVWTEDTMTRIDTDDYLADYPDDPAASIGLAKIEYEGFQIGIKPASGRRLDNVSATVSDLTSGGNTISSSNIDWEVVGLIQSGASYYPDILLDMTDFDMQTDYTHAILVTVYCPTGQAAGTYTGTVTIKTDSGLDTVVDVTCEVYDITLPAAVGHCKTSIDLLKDSKNWDAGEFLEYCDFLLAWRMNPDDIYCHNDPYVPAEGDMWSITDLEHLYANGMNYFTVCKADNFNNAQGITTIGNWLGDLALSDDGAALRAMGCFYGYDEKNPPDYGGMASGFGTMRTNFSDIERMTTAHIYCPSTGPWLDPVGDMDTYSMDIICAQAGYYDFDDGELLRNNGYAQWLYHDGVGITNTLIYPRRTFWNQYRQKAEGFLYFCINDWYGMPNPTPIDPDDGPFIDYTFRTWSSGIAEIIYCGTDGPIGSLRLMNMRDGVEDYEYLYAMAERIEDVEVAREISEDVTWGQQEYTTDPDVVQAARDALVGWLTQDYLAKDPTPDHRSIGADPTADLTWEADSVDVDSFNVYFATAYDDVLYADTDSDAYKGNQAGVTYDPGTLAKSNVTYYWRIDEVVDAAVYTGYVWKFECGYGLCGLWKFDETTGTTAEDASGLDNDGAIVGDVDFADGASAGAFQFNHNGEVSIGAEALETIDKEVTVAFWHYGDPCQPQYQWVFGAQTAEGGTFMQLCLPSDNKYAYWYAAGDLTTLLMDMYEMKNRWNHWTFTKNATTGYMKIYLNGDVVSSSGSRTQAFGTPGAFKIGCTGASAYDYEGRLDDFRVYDSELSQDEITDLYESYEFVGGYGLVGHWAFDELSGSTAKDSSDYLNHATITGATRVAGKVGNALSFDGTNDYVDVPCDGLTSPGMEITLAVWTYGDAALPNASNVYVVRATRSDSSLALCAGIPHPNGCIFFRAGSTAGADTKFSPTADAGEYKGQWNHWVFTRGTLGLVNMYLNGEHYHYDGNYGIADIGTFDAFRIGSSTTGTYPYKGKLDEVRLYNYELSATEIENLYDADAADFSGLIGHWKFDEDAGATAGDETAFGNDGAITGAAWVDGVTGSALDFEGADYVSVPVTALWSLDRKVTVALWQYGDAAIQPQYDNIIGATSGDSYTVFTWYLPEDFGVAVRTYVGGGSGGSDLAYKVASESEYEGTWHHWAFTKDAWSGEIKVYLDGALWNTTTNRWRPLSQAANFKIGSSSTGTLNYDGMIDDVRVYNIELAAADIADIVAEAPPLPNELTWSTEPFATGPSSVLMTATTATHDNGVEYYFDCTAGGGADSGWQEAAHYEDTGLSANTEYTYRVQTRDATNEVEGGWSSSKSATTTAE